MIETLPRLVEEAAENVPHHTLSFWEKNKSKIKIILIAVGATLPLVLLASYFGNKFFYQKPTAISEKVLEKPAADNETIEWKTYSNNTAGYVINYPSNWAVREFETGAAFRPADQPDDYQHEYISINKYNRVILDDLPNPSFDEYVKKASAEIQNYGDLVSFKQITTDAKVTGYTATWKVTPLGSGEASESLPRTYFAIPENDSATIQVVLENADYLNLYQQMLTSFKWLQKKSSTENPNLKSYHSSKLGVSFTYLAKQGLEEVHVTENDNKICLSYIANDNSCEQGQVVEVFDKAATETLAAAIKRIFLADKDPARCLVTVSDPSNYPPTFVQATITFPSDGEFDLEKMFANTKYCAADYAQSNGIRYFLEDKLHPQKFLFFGIGQYAIFSENDQPWQETINLE